MTQVFADGERLDGTGMHPGQLHAHGQFYAHDQFHARPMVRQRTAAPDHQQVPTDALGPALTAGKGVRPVRCVGCSEQTLPRQDDDAPLCASCSDRLAGSAAGSASAAGRWRWRWLAGD